MIQGEFEGLGRLALSVAFLSIPVGHKLKQLIETFVKSQPPPPFPSKQQQQRLFPVTDRTFTVLNIMFLGTNAMYVVLVLNIVLLP